MEFKDKAIDDEYADLDDEASHLESELEAINKRQKFIRDNYEVE
jgi:hypothetical protein